MVPSRETSGSLPVRLRVVRKVLTMLSEKQIVVRLPEELLAKIDALIPSIKSQAGTSSRITRSWVVRMALTRGLEQFEQELGDGGGMDDGGLLRSHVARIIREELTCLNGAGHLAGGEIEGSVKKKLRLGTGANKT